jgi:outer membrane immunogenic protein
MKKLLLLSTAFVCAPCAAFAAPAYNWTGFYVGAHAGYGWADHHVADDNPTVAYDLDPDGFVGGAQAGFDYQFGHFLVGIEGDISWTDMNTRGPTSGGVEIATVDVEYLASLRARLGYTIQSLLIYVTGGAAWGQFTDANFFLGGTQFGEDLEHRESGWTVGLGAEYPLGPQWTMKFDYLHYEFDGVESPNAFPFWGIGRDHFETDVDTIRAGINFRIGG